jgi:imidazolonepropionase-like amidohydrolase
MMLVAIAAQALVITHATLWDGTGAPARAGMTIVMQNGRISALHADGAQPLPAGAEVRDVASGFVMPGLIDAHVHLATNPSSADRRDRVEQRLRLALQGGVVAVRDMGGDARALADLGRASAAGDIAAPEIHYSAIFAGPAFFADPRVLASSVGRAPGAAPWTRAVTDTTNLAQAVAEARGAGATAVKMYAALDSATAARVAAEAKRQGLGVWAHLALFPARPSEVVAAGVEVVSHALLVSWEAAPSMPEYTRRAQVDLAIGADAPAVTRLFALMRERHTMFEPTLFVYRGDTAAPDTTLGQRRLARAIEFTRAAHAAGVTIVAGTDGIGGETAGVLPNIHDELALLVRAGLTPAEALVAATGTAARAAGFGDHGTIAVGQAADLLVLDADPTADIRNTRRIALVIRRGRAVPR